MELKNHPQDAYIKNSHNMSVPLYFPRRRKREEDISRVQHHKSDKEEVLKTIFKE